MNLFFSKKHHPKRKELRLLFEQITSALHCAEDKTMLNVGHGINMAHTLFIQYFKNLDTFSQQPKAEKIKFLKTLAAYELHTSLNDEPTLLGLSLFGMWVDVLSEGDDELVSQFSKELKYFSHKSDLASKRELSSNTLISFASNEPEKSSNFIPPNQAQRLPSTLPVPDSY